MFRIFISAHVFSPAKCKGKQRRIKRLGRGFRLTSLPLSSPVLWFIQKWLTIDHIYFYYSRWRHRLVRRYYIPTDASSRVVLRTRSSHRRTTKLTIISSWQHWRRRSRHLDCRTRVSSVTLYEHVIRLVLLTKFAFVFLTFLMSNV